MHINLAAPLAWKQASSEELKLLQSLQGHVLKHHGRDFVNLIFFKLNPANQLESKRMLRQLANFHLTSAHRQLLDVEHFNATRESGGPFAHLALSFKGYQALGVADRAPNDPDFQKGM